MQCIYCHAPFVTNHGDADDSLCGTCVRTFGELDPKFGDGSPSAELAHRRVSRLHHERIIARHQLGWPICDLRL